MRSVWSERAKKSLHIVGDYILREFGEKKRAEFMAEAEKIAIQLESFPKDGKRRTIVGTSSETLSQLCNYAFEQDDISCR